MLKSSNESKEGAVMRTMTAALSLVLLLAGCATKEQTKLERSYEKEKNYHATLIKTEKAQLYRDGLTKVLLTATYLNEQNASKDTAEEDERFIVGLYVDESVDNTLLNDFNLTLDGTPPKEIVPLKEKDPRLKLVSFKAPWNRFFLVTFPYTPKKRFKLIFESDAYGRKELDFAKKAKYTFTHTAF